MSNSTPCRPRRSILYVPGANERALEKAKTLSADAFIFDLEDAVAPSQKEQARALVCTKVRQGGYGQRELTIRINGAGTPWHGDDLQAALDARPSAIVLPKVSAAEDVQAVERELGAIAATAGIHLWAVIETPLGVLNALKIAESTPRLTALVVGTNDLTSQLHAENLPGRTPLLWALSQCVAAARAAGKLVFDGVYNDLQNPAGFEQECAQAKSLGFDGKTLIHPSQIELCNRIFMPTAAEIEHAKQTIAAFEEAANQGLGVAIINGHLVENVHYAAARRLLEFGQAVEFLSKRVADG